MTDFLGRVLSSRANRRCVLGGAASVALLAGSGHRPALAQGSGNAAVVSSHYLATSAGIEILEAGGTAADAAIAVATVLSVVEPYFSSALGGGIWALYYEAETGEVTSLDGVGPVGSLATLENYAERADAPGMHQANVPGAWDGWMLWLQRYGSLDLDLILAPAITHARDGFPMSAQMLSYLERFQENYIDFPDTVETYMPEGELPVVNEAFALPELAATFQALADAYANTDGDRDAKVQAARDHYYRGPIAEAIVAFSEENNGYFALEDFADFEAEIVTPISIDYRGMDVYQSPPNSQGIAMLLALNTLKWFDLSQVGPNDANTIHVQVEAIKLAYADRYALVGDPAAVDVPVEDLLSDEYGRSQVDRIDLGNAAEWPIDNGLEGRRASHTTTFHIVDQWGNAAAVTTSLGFQFLVVGDTGIHINERNHFMSLEEGNPNVFAPGKKVRHTSCPYMVLRNGTPVILGGNTGIDTQPQAQMQQFMNMADFGMTAQEAVDQPRFVSTSFPATTYPYDALNVLQMEDGFPEETIEALESRGHQVSVGDGIFGNAHAIVINEGALDVGAESRADDATYETLP